MSKSKEDWDKSWEAAEGNDFNKAITLLAEYAGYGELAKNCWGMLDLCGGLYRFFSCRWNTNYGKEVLQTLKQFDVDNMLSHGQDESVNTVDNLFGLLKYNLHGNDLQNDGDLSKIVETIEIKTGIKYRHCDEKKYRQSVELSITNSL